MWAVVYENGMSLTIASEQTARSLAQAERDRGRIVSVRHVDDVVTHPGSAEKAARQADGLPEPEPIRAAAEVIRAAAEFASPEPISRPELISQPEPASTPEPAQVVEPLQAMPPAQAAEPASPPEPASEASPPESTREPEPTRTPTPARRRLPLYAAAAAVIVVAAALANHWGVLPRLGASTSSSPTHVSRPPRPSRPPRLLPPLGQPPVMHFGSALVQPDRQYLPNAHGPRRLRASVGRPSTIARRG